MVTLKKTRLYRLALVLGVLLVIGLMAACGSRKGEPAASTGPEGATSGGDAAAGSEAGGSGAAQQPEDQPAAAETIPAAPGSLAADHIPVFDVTVSWQDNSNNEDGFRIYRQRVDMPDLLTLIGEVDVDTTSFHDSGTLCGATYQYIIASFNEVGESPASACWQITLPPCRDIASASLAGGAENALNAAAGTVGTDGDFYLDFSSGTVQLKADLEGQVGLVELGPGDESLLYTLRFPDDPVFVRDGVAVQPGNMYAAGVRGSGDLVLLMVDNLSSTVGLRYTIWPNQDLINVGECTPGFDLLTGGGPGTPCISGDDVCNPLCVSVPEEYRDVPTGDVPPEQIMPDEPGSTAEIHRQCLAEVLATLPPAPTPAQIAAAQAAYYDCVAGQTGISLGEIVGMLTTMVAVPGVPSDQVPGDGPRYSDRDLDCEDDPCIPGDDICNPLCGPPQEPMPGLLSALPRDPDCQPGDEPDAKRLYYCGRQTPPELAEAGWVLVSSQDYEPDGTIDRRAFYNGMPGSLYFGSYLVWDTFCPDQPGDRPGREVVREPVWYCTYIGNSLFEWYEVERVFVDGVAVSESIVSGPYTGPWQPGCPPAPDEPEEPGQQCECVCYVFGSGVVCYDSCTQQICQP
ncbi:MAG: hypothetical protein Kow00124_29340 [Anaerolineae bacterium]